MNKAVALLMVLLALGGSRSAAAERTLIATSQDHSLGGADDCDHFHTQTLTSFPAQAQSQEQRELSVNGIQLLKVRASYAGGISIKGWDKPNARLTICKSAVAQTRQLAQRVLDSVSIDVRGGEISAAGPDLDNTQLWWVHMILYVPRGANLDVQSEDGGIAIRNMSGKVNAQSSNGGISLAYCAGDNIVRTQNGGISLDKIGGRLDAATQNGPISLKLRDEIPALEARTDPTGEILCNVNRCSDGLGRWAADRKTLRLGTRTPSIRLSTNNAPIMIEQVR